MQVGMLIQVLETFDPDLHVFMDVRVTRGGTPPEPIRIREPVICAGHDSGAGGSGLDVVVMLRNEEEHGDIVAVGP